ncbi:MAG: hypothetical protein P4M07_08390 [Xanthobacteraceae bacterium]|nr:hypothetical protein [Xanthobacteraceae bacterium]
MYRAPARARHVAVRDVFRPRNDCVSNRSHDDRHHVDDGITDLPKFRAAMAALSAFGQSRHGATTSTVSKSGTRRSIAEFDGQAS